MVAASGGVRPGDPARSQATIEVRNLFILRQLPRADTGRNMSAAILRLFTAKHVVPIAPIIPLPADAMFDEDIVDRAEKWVKAYVKVPLSQEQFDALSHMAYNLKPASFRRIAG